MQERRRSAAAALVEGLAFTDAAWRDLWGVQVLFALGAAIVFASLRAPLPGPAGADLGAYGVAVVGVTVVPLWAGLYRRALGGRLLRELGPSGLQIGLAELRLVALAAAALAALALIVLLLIGVSAGVFAAFGELGSVELPQVGEVRSAFLVAGTAWALGAVAFAWGLLRLLFALPATVGRRRVVAAEVWGWTDGAVAPLAVAVGAAQSPAAALIGAWCFVPATGWGEALGMGAVIGFALAFVQAPLTVGALTALYRAERARRAALPASVSPTMSDIPSQGWAAEAPSAA